MSEKPKPDFTSARQLLERYFPLDDIPVFEERILSHPKRRPANWVGARNRHGYRGDEFDERRAFNVAVLGCSWVEGAGVARPQIFTDQLRELLKERTGRGVSVWNLGMSGTGLDYVARIVQPVCRVLRPDAIVVVASGIDRREFFTADGRRIFANAASVAGRNKRIAYHEADDHVWDALQVFFDSEYDCLAQALKNFRAIEATVSAARIPWVYSWIGAPVAEDAMGLLLENGQLPAANYLGHAFEIHDYVSETNRHPGPESHRIFADSLAHRLAAVGRRSLWSRLTDRLPGRTSLAKPNARPTGRAKEDVPDEVYPLW